MRVSCVWMNDGFLSDGADMYVYFNVRCCLVGKA